MSDAPKPARRGERFTMLPAMGPNNPIPGSEAWPVVDLPPPDPSDLTPPPDAVDPADTLTDRPPGPPRR